MAGSFSDYTENALLDGLLGGPNYSKAATVYVALFTARGTTAQADAGTNFTEVSTNAYARAAVTNNATNWPAASGGAKSNGAAVTFPTPTGGGWGTVVAFGIYDASTGGNLLCWGDLTISKAINEGDPVSFPIGDIDVTLD